MCLERTGDFQMVEGGGRAASLSLGLPDVHVLQFPSASASLAIVVHGHLAAGG